MNIEKEATHYLPNPDGSIALLYKWNYSKMNDGTTGKGLAYLSSCGGGWMGSSERDPEKFFNEKLKPLKK